MGQTVPAVWIAEPQSTVTKGQDIASETGQPYKVQHWVLRRSPGKATSGGVPYVFMSAVHGIQSPEPYTVKLLLAVGSTMEWHFPWWLHDGGLDTGFLRDLLQCSWDFRGTVVEYWNNHCLNRRIGGSRVV